MSVTTDDLRNQGDTGSAPGANLSTKQLRLVTALSFVLTVLLVAFPRFATVNLFGIILAVVLLDPIVRYARGKPNVGWIRPANAPSILFPALLFLLWAAISLMWSANPSGGTVKMLLFAGLLAMCLGTSEGIRTADTRLLQAIVTGFMAGMALSAAYIFIETISARKLGRFLLSHLTFLVPGDHKHIKVLRAGVVQVSDANINRSTAVFCLLLWPAILAAARLTEQRRRWFYMTIFGLTGTVLMVWSRHQSSQVALAVSALVLGIAFLSPFFTRRLMAAGWISILVLIVPLSLLAFKYELHLKPWLFHTAQARVIMWNCTAERVLEHPIAGVGIDATKTLDRAREAEKVVPKGFATAPETRAHPHNAYLQIWYELGLVGACLIGWFGLRMIASSTKLPEPMQPFALAQMTSIAAVIASSYGFWQTWLQASIALSFLALLAAIRVSSLSKN